jgi:hypothetical protein
MNCLIQTIVLVVAVGGTYLLMTPARVRRINEAVHPFFERLRERLNRASRAAQPQAAK